MGRFKNEQGSITLEAAIIFPFFLFFMLFLITIIQLARVDIALGNAVSESTKQISTHMYPVYISYEWFKANPYGQKIHEVYSQVSEGIIQAEELMRDYEGLFPEHTRLYFEKKEELKGAVSEAVNNAFQPAVFAFADENILESERFKITKMTFPNFESKNLYFGIEVEYTYKFPVPFFNQEIKMKKKAMERVWVGNP